MGYTLGVYLQTTYDAYFWVTLKQYITQEINRIPFWEVYVIWGISKNKIRDLGVKGFYFNCFGKMDKNLKENSQ